MAYEMKTFWVEPPAYKRITLRQSLLFALMSAFMIGFEFVVIEDLLEARRSRQDLVFEVTYLALWVILGLRWGRGVWEHTREAISDPKQGGTA